MAFEVVVQGADQAAEALGITRKRTPWREEDAAVRLERVERLDLPQDACVLCDEGSALRPRYLNDFRVRESDELAALLHSDDVVAPIAESLRNGSRVHLIQQEPQAIVRRAFASFS